VRRFHFLIVAFQYLRQLSSFGTSMRRYDLSWSFVGYQSAWLQPQRFWTFNALFV